jgi:hypothetical protein
MAKLLANRWFRWTLLASSGLGVGIYRFTPPEPRGLQQSLENLPNAASKWQAPAC